MATAHRTEILLGRNAEHQILNEWDARFLQSIHEQLEKNRTLSVRQNDILQKIESKLSDDAIGEVKAWEKNWDRETREKAVICAKYYAKIGTYFRDIAAKVLEEPEWIVPMTTYKKMCENKYAKKILAIAMAEAKYPCGCVIMLRDTAQKSLGWIKYEEMKGKPLFVLEILQDVHNAAKGAKRYRVLAAGAIKPVELEERQIKKYRKGKISKKPAYDHIPF